MAAAIQDKPMHDMSVADLYNQFVGMAEAGELTDAERKHLKEVYWACFDSNPFIFGLGFNGPEIYAKNLHKNSPDKPLAEYGIQSLGFVAMNLGGVWHDSAGARFGSALLEHVCAAMAHRLKADKDKLTAEEAMQIHISLCDAVKLSAEDGVLVAPNAQAALQGAAQAAGSLWAQKTYG